KINHLSGVFVPQTALSREELYFSNNSKAANVSKSFLIPNEDLSDDTTPSVARKFLNEKEAAKFVGDFKSLANEADASLAKHKALELEIKRLLKAVVSQDIMIIVQNQSVVETLDLQTELERTKERFKNCIIKKENEYAKLWNDWYKKCDECKYDKISYDKAYKDIQQKIERLQAQLGDLKGKSKDTSSVSDTRNPENAHLKATYKNLFDSLSVSRAQTKTIIASLQNEIQSNIYKNAKLRTQLFKKVSDQKDNTQDSSVNTKFAKQPIVENLPKVGKTYALSNLVTSNSVSTPQESKGVKNDKVIALGMLKINPSKTSREEKHVPNIVRASARTKPITVSQPHVITKKDEAAKFVGDFKSLANKADASLAKHKALEVEIKRLLKAVVSQDILIIVQNESVVDTSDLQTELERTKERFENCIIKKESEYSKLWNDWYKKCDECKYDQISYDKAYKDMQQKIELLQAQLGDLKGNCKGTSCVPDTQNPLSQKLENENVELEF
nr:hypothetical protein [Tanacetum cinerariifolium]